MANIARGEAECYISIEAECRVLYFMYTTWQGNDLSVIKNFLNIRALATIKHTKFTLILLTIQILMYSLKML